MLPVIKVSLACLDDIVGIFTTCKRIGIVRSATQELRSDEPMASYTDGDYMGTISSSSSENSFKISVFKVSTRKRIFFSGMNSDSSPTSINEAYRLRFPELLINPFTKHSNDVESERNSIVYNYFNKQLDGVIPNDLTEAQYFQYSLLEELPDLEDIRFGHQICSSLNVLQDYTWLQVSRDSGFIDDDVDAIKNIVRKLYESII